MGKPGPVVVSLRGQKHLSLVLQPPERLGVDYPVPVALETRPQRSFSFIPYASPAHRAETRPWVQDLPFEFLGLPTDGHHAYWNQTARFPLKRIPPGGGRSTEEGCPGIMI